MIRKLIGLFMLCVLSSADVAQAACSNEVLYFLDKISKDTAVLASIKAQNDVFKSIDQKKIDQLDEAWRAAVKSGKNQSELNALLKQPVSVQLANLQSNTTGLITEIIIMDKNGLNVAISQATSDYWQGDEAKWQKTFAVGAKATHVSDVYLDESTNLFQVQISRTVKDPETEEPIGAITIGYNVKRLVGSLVGLDIGR